MRVVIDFDVIQPADDKASENFGLAVKPFNQPMVKLVRE
jgi:hypothetical protein